MIGARAADMIAEAVVAMEFRAVPRNISKNFSTLITFTRSY